MRAPVSEAEVFVDATALGLYRLEGGVGQELDHVRKRKPGPCIENSTLGHRA